MPHPLLGKVDSTTDVDDLSSYVRGYFRIFYIYLIVLYKYFDI